MRPISTIPIMLALARETSIDAEMLEFRMTKFFGLLPIEAAILAS
jgi:hypothetical protein